MLREFSLLQNDKVIGSSSALVILFFFIYILLELF